MAKELPDGALEDAEAAVAFAKLVRRTHRRRTKRSWTSSQRNADIELALTRLKEAMAPLKSAIGRFPHEAQTEAAEARRAPIRQASRAIQAERRKLWKMRTPSIEET